MKQRFAFLVLCWMLHGCRRSQQPDVQVVHRDVVLTDVRSVDAVLDVVAPPVPAALAWGAIPAWNPPSQSMMLPDTSVSSWIEAPVELVAFHSGALGIGAMASINNDVTALVVRKFDARGRGVGPFRQLATTTDEVVSVRAATLGNDVWVVWRTEGENGAVIQAMAVRSNLSQRSAPITIDTIPGAGSKGPPVLAVLPRADGGAYVLWAGAYNGAARSVEVPSEIHHWDTRTIHVRDVSIRVGRIDAQHRLTVVHTHSNAVAALDEERSNEWDLGSIAWVASLAETTSGVFAHAWIDGLRERESVWHVPAVSTEPMRVDGIDLFASPALLGTSGDELLVLAFGYLSEANLALPMSYERYAVRVASEGVGVPTLTRSARFELEELGCARERVFYSARSGMPIDLTGANRRMDLSYVLAPVSASGSYRPVPMTSDRLVYTGIYVLRAAIAEDLLRHELQRFRCTGGAFQEVGVPVTDAGLLMDASVP